LPTGKVSAVQKTAMRTPLHVFSAALISISCIAPLMAQAQIVKCVDQDGRTSYSDTTCANAVSMTLIEADRPVPAVATAAATLTQAATVLTADDSPLHDSSWARLPMKAKVSSDSETVAQARATLAQMDRALVDIRMHKVASAR
jgi:phosphosulfolactate phosphohydrolase-like enzyme